MSLPFEYDHVTVGEFGGNTPLATDSAKVSVQADATIALPLLVSALAATAPPLLAARRMPAFTLAGRVMTVDGHTVPNERFEEVNEPAV